MAKVAEQTPLAQALAALQRGQGAEAEAILQQAAKPFGRTGPPDWRFRMALVDALLLQDELERAQRLLGRPPDEGRSRLEPSHLSALWRLHGQIAFARGEPSRAVALVGRALKQAERAHDSEAIGLAHYELARAYRQIGDFATVREHLAKAATALHAAGNRRALAQVHSHSGVVLAQDGRYDEAMAALRQAERFAGLVSADDVLATACGNQANVALMQHRHEQALELAERSVALQEQNGAPHGLGVALASLGQICVRLGNLTRAEEVLRRALDIPSSELFRRETTGAVFDTLAQIHLIRGDYDDASDCLLRAAHAYGEYGQAASQWYQWSLQVLEARLELKQERPQKALALADAIAHAVAAPAIYALQAELVAAEAALSAGQLQQASDRLATVGGRLEPREMPGPWGEFLRVRGSVHAKSGATSDAYHDLSQSVSVFDLLSERYQMGLSYLALGEFVASAGARSKALRHLALAESLFDGLGARPDLVKTRDAIARVPVAGTGDYIGVQADDSAVVRRLVEAAALPDLLAREAAQALHEACDAEVTVLAVRPPDREPRVVAHAGRDLESARAMALAVTRSSAADPGSVLIEPIGSAADGPRFAILAGSRPFGPLALQRFRTLCAIVRQGFELCRARERPAEPAVAGTDTALEPLLPGFVCASAAMARVAEQIQRLQGNDLTVLVTGESGTGKDLVARAIHAGSPRRSELFLPYNCTSATRELADSQLFGHRRGSFTGAVADQPGLIRAAAGGTIFLDEIADLPLDVQPKLLRFLEQGEILPVGETRPLSVDVRVIAATNADLEQRVSEARFREDLFYRLSVIRIHVPPLRDRREEIPHLSTFFLRETSERLGKPDVRLSPATLELFDEYQWPGNVRQLRNEIQRAVAMATDGSLIEPEHLSPQLAGQAGSSGGRARPRRMTLGAAIDKLEREMIRAALDRTRGNISETARSLGLTRRGLYLKVRRLGLQVPGDLA
jgi:hydrogenase-4 transcriptional activator